MTNLWSDLLLEVLGFLSDLNKVFEPTADQHHINIGPDATETSSIEMGPERRTGLA